MSRLQRWRRRATAQLRLIWRLLRDARVPLPAKLVLPALLLYLLLPLDIIPDFIPVLGQLDDVLVAALTMKLFVRLCPRDIVQEHLGRMETIPAGFRGAGTPNREETSLAV